MERGQVIVTRKIDPLQDDTLSRLGNTVLSYRLKCLVLLYVCWSLLPVSELPISRFLQCVGHVLANHSCQEQKKTLNVTTV